MRKLLIISFLFLLSFNIYSQGITDSLQLILIKPAGDRLITKFDKQLNTYLLNSFLNYYHQFDRISLNVSEDYSSSFIKTGGKSIRDQHYFNLKTNYSLTENFDMGIFLANSILSDNRRIEINQASVSNFILFSGFKPVSELTLSPFGGYSNNRQIGENDYGFIYGGEALYNDEEQSDLNLFSQAKFQNEDISPRKNAIRYFTLQAANNFSPEVSNTIDFNYALNRKDFYYAADSITSVQFDIANNIQTRTETDYAVQNKLRYNNFLNFLTLDLAGRVAWRYIDRDTKYRSTDNPSTSIFDTRVDEFRMDVESSIDYHSQSFDLDTRLLYSERNEKHITKNFAGINRIFFDERSELENRKNNHSIRAALSLVGNWRISSADQIYFSLLQNKLKYDTPNENNFDDRDELLSIIRLRYTRKFSPFFYGFVNLEGTQSHTVYIFSSKSSNNNINRILSLESGGNYLGKNISSFNSFRVSANYTVYDFEDLNPNYRSFSFRQFTATDSTKIYFTRNLFLTIYGYIKLSEQGDFRWSSFSVKPSRFLEEIYTEPKINFNVSGILFSPGIRLFSLKTFSYEGKEKIIESRYYSLGPAAEILFKVRNSIFLKVYGWYEFITINSSQKKELVNLTMQLEWNF